MTPPYTATTMNNSLGSHSSNSKESYPGTTPATTVLLSSSPSKLSSSSMAATSLPQQSPSSLLSSSAAPLTTSSSVPQNQLNAATATSSVSSSPKASPKFARLRASLSSEAGDVVPPPLKQEKEQQQQKKSDRRSSPQTPEDLTLFVEDLLTQMVCHVCLFGTRTIFQRTG